MVKDDPKESWNGIETETELDNRRWACRLAWWGSTEKKEATHLLGLRGTSTQISAPVESELLV